MAKGKRTYPVRKPAPRHVEGKDEFAGKREKVYCSDCCLIKARSHKCKPVCKRCKKTFLPEAKCLEYCDSFPCCGCCNKEDNEDDKEKDEGDEKEEDDDGSEAERASQEASDSADTVLLCETGEDS